jgi:transketolase
MDPKSVPQLKHVANHVRRHVLEMIHAAKSGHPGGCLSAVEFTVALYYNHLDFKVDDPEWEGRDRIYWSKGHVAPLIYTIMSEVGYFDNELLCTLRQLGSPLQGHPSADRCHGLEVSSGSLGQGLSIAVGTALGLRLDSSPARVYCIMGDGEQDEGQIWEAFMAGAHFKLENLCAIVDYNQLQIDGRVQDVMNIDPLPAKYRAFNWNVIEIDGHDIQQCLDAFEQAKAHKGQPSVIVASTVKGKGVSFMEDVADWHGKCPNAEELAKALAELEEEAATI